MRRIVAMILLGLATLPAGAARGQEAVSTEDMVNALNELFGSHKGFRAVHAKGFCGAGSFQATPEAPKLTKAAVFDGRAVPAMFRFSLGHGVPTASDRDRTRRSLTVRLEPPGGDSMDLLMLNVPFIFMRTPADFAPFFRALAPDPATGKPNEAKLKALFEQRPHTKRFLDHVTANPASASYAQSRYFAIHTFYFINDKGERRPARWIAEPLAGEASLTDQQMTSGPTDFLEEDLRQRVAKAPVEWDLYLQFPEPGDPLDDPTVAWPTDRKKQKMGRLKVTAVETNASKGPCDEIMFDPTMLPDGVEPSNDPVLLVRREAYAVSFARRMSQ